MLWKISFTLIGVTAIVCMLALLLLVRFLNPYRAQASRLVRDHANTLHFGAYADVFDLSLPQRTERLFVIRPENVVLYNTNGALFYYLESSNVLCPREFTIVRFTNRDIDAINQNNVYSTLCTSVNSLTLLEHFLTLKNNIPDERLVLSADQINYSILDIINLLIYTGYVNIE
nr:pif4 [Calliteara abietis nucleopolyhedrovirus]